MREIKFRAYRKDIKKLISPPRTLEDLVCKDYINSFEHLELMQFTGLKDKNDVEIYEGDILEIEYDGEKYSRNGERFEVVYIRNVASYELRENSGELYGLDIDELGDLKVIGNIYENPELLKEHNENI